jgi:uncharacterized protein
MLILLSPAKSLDYQSPLPEVPHTQPLFVKQSAELIALLREKSPQQIAGLMGLSDKLAQLNVARYQAWRQRFNASNSRPAVLAFNGNVYGGLDARNLATNELAWLQEHLCILSGLYGVLRPLDWMQPYRLEMGTALENGEGKNLYQFWASHISKYLNQRLRSDLAPVVLNLASQEYFKALDLKALKARVVDCVFEEYRAGRYKVIALHAKRARGLMARYAAQQKALTPQQLQGFDVEGYAFAAGASGPQRLVFRRDGPAS